MTTKVRIGLEEFLSRSGEHKTISRHNYDVEDTNVMIKLIKIDKVDNSEFLKFEFEEPVYLPVEKIYFNLQQVLMVIAPPFLYTDSTDNVGGGFHISKAYTVCCDGCGNDINYINTNLVKFYCDDCFENDMAIEEKNILIVLGGSLVSS